MPGAAPLSPRADRHRVAAANSRCVPAAWVVLAGVSALPTIVAQEVLKLEVTGEARSAIAASVAGVGLIVARIRPRLRPLMPLGLVLVVLIAAEWLVFQVLGRSPVVRALATDPSFTTRILCEQALRLIVTLAIVAVLLGARGRPSTFFMTPGDLRAPMSPIPWLGVRGGTRWSRFAPLAAMALSAGTLAFLLLAAQPSPAQLAGVLPFLPLVLLVAALNAFNEEVTYKGAMLSVLDGPVGAHQALLMVSAYFGVGHFYGVPYGLVGVLMAFTLGWLLGRSMLETGGMFWAWFLHFCQDVLIFAFLAIGSITPGG